MAAYRLLPGRLVGTAILATVVGVTGAASSSSLPAVHVMSRAVAERHDPVKISTRRADGVSNSTNWSGYAVTGATGSVTVASGSWTVPAVTCPSTTSQYASFWVGIDGFNSNTVEQTGTDSDCSGTTPQYYAWFEFYPKISYNISSSQIGPIAPGTQMSATITLNPQAGTSTVTLVNNSQNNQTFTITQKIASARGTSAEWILESPSGQGGILTIAQFAQASFYASQATVAAKTGSIAQFLEPNCQTAANPIACSNVVQEMTLVQPTGAGAQPSNLDSTGGGFTVTYVPPSTPPKKHGSR
jgi:hypothetical protein